VLSDDIKYLSNSSLRLADFLNKAARDDIGIGLNNLDWLVYCFMELTKAIQFFILFS
jgi:hypothetical protein